MPQLEVSTYLTQIFWVILTFIAFWGIMDKFIIPRIADTIEARKRKYDDFIMKAEEVNKKALDALRRYEETLAAAKVGADEQIQRNEAELKQIVAGKEEEINAQLKKKIAESEEKLRIEKGETMQKIKELSETAAFEIVRQLDLSAITMDDIRKASIGKESK